MIENSRARGRLTILLATALALWAPQAALPQANTATLHGTVTDPSGAAIAEANVTLTNDGTRAVVTQKSGAGGEFVFAFVPPGTYSLRIEAAGFKTLTAAGISLSAGQQARPSCSTRSRGPGTRAGGPLPAPGLAPRCSRRP